MSSSNVGIYVQPRTGDVQVTGNVLPTSCNVYDLGSAGARWRDLYLSGDTIDLGGTAISRDAATGGLKVSDSASGGAPLDLTVKNLVASNVQVIGDFVTLNTVTSNTEQVVVTNAGTGPALKVTQTGAQPIADFYDDGNVLALRMADGGNVGIGTGTPATKLDVAGILKATGLQINDITNAFMPRGGIIMWSGTVATIPTGWALCDGTNGTPDLRGRFVIGSSTTYSQGTSGGSATKTLSEANMPAHNHSGTTTSGEGTHTHTITDPGHSHSGSSAAQTQTQSGNGLVSGSGNPPVVSAGTIAAANTTGITINSANSAHTHTFATDTKGSGTAFDILPPYYSLAYIMKL